MQKKQQHTHTYTDTRAHVRPPPANTCSTHQSPIPDRNPKSPVRLLSHSQIMMDDNFLQQSLRVPASFSRTRQPGPGRTPLLSVFFSPGGPSRPGRLPPRSPSSPPSPALSFFWERKNLRGRRIKAGTGGTSLARVPHCESEALLNPTNLPWFACEEVKSTSDSLLRHTTTTLIPRSERWQNI